MLHLLLFHDNSGYANAPNILSCLRFMSFKFLFRAFCVLHYTRIFSLWRLTSQWSKKVKVNQASNGTALPLHLLVSIEQSPYWQTASSSDAREIFRLFRNPEVRYGVNKRSLCWRLDRLLLASCFVWFVHPLSDASTGVCSVPYTFSVKQRFYSVTS
jgi:hypothetical protein